jgi:hypothetical protein
MTVLLLFTPQGRGVISTPFPLIVDLNPRWFQESWTPIKCSSFPQCDREDQTNLSKAMDKKISSLPSTDPVPRILFTKV